MLHAFPRAAVEFHYGEQILLVGADTSCRFGQAPQIGLKGLDAACQIGETSVETVKQDGTPQLGRLERAFRDRAHEDSSTRIVE
jgi:hypothetical protein